MFSFFCLTFLLLTSCAKEGEPNPFDVVIPDGSTTQVVLNPKSIEGLYHNIFLPTCANSGCHDGTFEPDFRTIESTYYSLVYQDVIKQNPSNPMNYRVMPGSSITSMLLTRLTIDLGGNSGIMPLATDPNSDWDDKSAAYIQDVKDWIDEGAKDVFGNPSTTVNIKPQLLGATITPSGSNQVFQRDVEGVIEIPNGTNAMDIYIAIDDKETAASSLTSAEVVLSLSFDNPNLGTVYTFDNIMSQTFPGYLNPNVSYYHKISITNVNTIWSPNEVVYLNTKVDDGDNGVVDLPGIYSMEHLKRYYSFKIL